MKKMKHLFKYGAVSLLALMLAFGAGCGDGSASDRNSGSDTAHTSDTGSSDTGSSETPVEKVTLTLGETVSAIKKGETVKMTVTVSGAADKTYTWSVSEPTILKVENDTVSVIGDIAVDKYVKVTATSNADPTVSASRNFLVKAPVIEGQVGELTSEMIQTIGNASITATGTVTDYYQDLKQAANSSENAYDIEVTMEDGAWSGSWNIQGNTYNVITDHYRRGTAEVTDQSGNFGHALEQLYINKDNQVTSSVVKDYLSFPAVWESQHLWNHLGNLSIEKFAYDAENEVYEYKIDFTDTDDLYLMTYLSVSLTPMLEDTLAEMYLVVEDGKITRLLGKTDVLYYGSDTNQDPDALSYTTISVDFSDVGTTDVTEPAPYAAPQNADKLAAALEKMGKADNYTYRTKDTTTYAPSPDEDDYSTASVSGASSGGAKALSAAASKSSVQTTAVENHTSTVGTVGCVGYVTSAAILLENTIQYTSTLDGASYRTEYTGYRQMDGYYEEFAYSSQEKALYGTKRVNGNMFDSMPSFEFSPNVFKYTGSSINPQTGKTTHSFVLNETAITRDIAMEISAYRYASSASASTSTTLTIVVDDTGNIVSATYPYSISSGTYLGYCTTTYADIGTTALDADLFDNYIPRKVKNSWSDYTTKYFSETYSTKDSHDEDTAKVLDYIYGETKIDLPAPSVLMEIFGDNINGPFYDWKETGKDANGNPTYTDWISITTTCPEYDENSKVSDESFAALMTEVRTALEKEGFAISPSNTDTTNSGRRYVCFIKNDIQIVINNNGTKYLWIYFYKTGDWTLSK